MKMDCYFWSVMAVVVVWLILSLGGCATRRDASERSPAPASVNESEQRFIAWLENSPCGVLHVSPPFFNISGALTMKARRNASIEFYVVRNTSLGAVMYSIGHCRPIMRGKIVDGEDFAFNSIPAGNYAVVMSAAAFLPGQGFPIVERFERQDYVLDYIFQGGDSYHSVGAFTITRADAER